METLLLIECAQDLQEMQDKNGMDKEELSYMFDDLFDIRVTGDLVRESSIDVLTHTGVPVANISIGRIPTNLISYIDEQVINKYCLTRVPFLNDVVVESDWQGLGIGSWLLNKMLDLYKPNLLFLHAHPSEYVSDVEGRVLELRDWYYNFGFRTIYNQNVDGIAPTVLMARNKPLNTVSIF